MMQTSIVALNTYLHRILGMVLRRQLAIYLRQRSCGSPASLGGQYGGQDGLSPTLEHGHRLRDVSPETLAGSRPLRFMAL